MWITGTLWRAVPSIVLNLYLKLVAQGLVFLVFWVWVFSNEKVIRLSTPYCVCTSNPSEDISNSVFLIKAPCFTPHDMPGHICYPILGFWTQLLKKILLCHVPGASRTSASTAVYLTYFFPQPEEKTLKFSFDTRLCGNPAYSFKKLGKMILVVMFIMVRSERSEI